MADRLKDQDDLRLESMFRSDPVRDDGFSVKVVSRVRRQAWVRRLSLPIAFALGALVSVKPLLQLMDLVPTLLGALPSGMISLENVPFGDLPQASTMILGAILLVTFAMAGRTIQE